MKLKAVLSFIKVLNILLLLLKSSQSQLQYYDDICKDRDCADEFKKTGIFHIANYLSNEEINDMLNEVLLLKNNSSYYSTDSHTIYQEDIDLSLNYNHIRNQLQNSSKLIIPSSKLSDNSLLRNIYQRNSLINLVKKVVGMEVYKSGCIHNAAYYNIYNINDELGWHFDRSTFGINLILQKSGEGGEFEYYHNTRSNEDMYSFNNVNNIINNNTNNNNNTINELNAGSLVIFAGKYSLHRVSKVIQNPVRINAILTFEKDPNVKTSKYTLKKFFGIDSNDYNNEL